MSDRDRGDRRWREIDAMRESKKAGGRNEGGHGGRMEKSQAYRSYKSQLNKLFDGGAELPDSVKEKLGNTEIASQAAERRALEEQIKETFSTRKLRKLVKQYEEAYGFPRHVDLLNKLLESDDEDLLYKVFQTIEEARVEGILGRTTALKARIKSTLVLVDAPEIQTLGKELLKKL